MRWLLGVLLTSLPKSISFSIQSYREELFHNIQKGVLRIPTSLSEDCKLLIVALLNRNPSKRLGAGPGGAEEIKKHPFFNGIDWEAVRDRKLKPPKPDINMKMFAVMQNYVEVPDEALKKVFDETEEDTESYENRTVEGWSFVGGPLPTAGN